MILGLLPALPDPLPWPLPAPGVLSLPIPPSAFTQAVPLPGTPFPTSPHDSACSPHRLFRCRPQVTFSEAASVHRS